MSFFVISLKLKVRDFLENFPSWRVQVNSLGLLNVGDTEGLKRALKRASKFNTHIG